MGKELFESLTSYFKFLIQKISLEPLNGTRPAMWAVPVDSCYSSLQSEKLKLGKLEKPNTKLILGRV